MARVVLAVVSALLVVLPAGAGTRAGTKTRVTDGRIESMAMDGSRVGFAVQGKACTKVFVWDPVGQSTALVSGKRTCGADSTSTGAGVREIAVAGSRVAWIVNLGGNNQSDDYLYTATLGKTREQRVAVAHRSVGAGGTEAGGWIGGLVGDGDLLAVDTWRTELDGSIPSVVLRTIGPAKSQPIATSLAAYKAASADAGRIAVARTDQSVALYSDTGTLLREIVPSSEQEVALEGGDLVVLTKTKTIEVYSATTGKSRGSWPVPDGAAHLDVSAGIAVFAVGQNVHALRLVDGKDVVLATAPTDVEALEIEVPGIAYAFNTRSHGKDVGTLAFVPRAKANALLG